MSLERLWSLFRDTARLDVLGLNPAYNVPGLSIVRIRRASLLLCFVKFWGHLLRRIPDLLQIRNKSPRKGVLFFAWTKNQHEALLPLALATEEDALVSEWWDRGGKIPLLFGYLLSVPFLPCLAYRYLRADRRERRTFSLAFDFYWLSYGLYLAYRLWLQRLAPRAVVVANDHTVFTLALCRAADAEGIASVYVQHACVTRRFPPLSFRYALLYGRNALARYEEAGESRTVVFLVGIPKFDARPEARNRRDRVRRIGLCTNLADPVEKVEDLVLCLAEELPDLELALRPHPTDRRRKLWKRMARRVGARISWAVEESARGFLATVDAIVAGDSSIHLEAVLMDVYPLCFDFADAGRDHYGFVANGLVESFDEAEPLLDRLAQLCEEKPSVRHRARAYDATMGSAFEGESVRLSASLMEQIRASSTLRPEPHWRRIQGTKLEAYRPYAPKEDRRKMYVSPLLSG